MRDSFLLFVRATTIFVRNKYTVPEKALRQDKQSELSGFILERTAKRMKQHFQQVLQAAGADVTIDQWVMLQALDKRDGQGQHELARAVFKDAPTVTRIIDLLCRKGLTRRRPDPEDRRRFRIFLTPAGRKKIGEVLPVVKRARRQAWEGLADEQIDQLVNTLNTVFRNLDRPATEKADS